MTTRSLTEWLQRIEALHPSEIELGLDRVSRVYRRLPDAAMPPVISVAGTNGKGSTVECITRCALQQGLRTGTYTSPHLVRFNERMCIDGKPADDHQIVRAFEQVERARTDTPLTYFEFTTLAALALFRAEGLDLWVLEVGLGGRLDAVNVVDAEVAVITQIGLDHQDWLGDTRELIGAEKAGIMRSGAVAVCSDPNPPESIAAKARDCGASLLQLGVDFGIRSHDRKWDFILGPDTAQKTLESLPAPTGAVLANLAGALTALSMLDHLPSSSDLGEVLRTWALPGRLQRLNLNVPWWLDVAHNEESAALLGQTLSRAMRDEELHQCTVVLGMLGDKPVDRVVEALADVATHWLIVDLDSPRALASSELAKKVKHVSAAPVECFRSVAAGMSVARARATPDSCVVVTGSFHTVGPALAWLGR